MSRLSERVRACVVFIGVSLVMVAWATPETLAQSGGAFAGRDQRDSRANRRAKDHLSVKEAKEVIVVQGVAEIRVTPSEIRLVMAVVSEGKTANECKQQAVRRVAALRKAWQKIGIESSDLFEDFISIIPVYRFEEQQKDSLTVLQEVLDGYRYQTNLHLKLPSEARAHEVLDVAFGLNITDIIVFDYWSPTLEEAKRQALKKAIGVARAKADILLAPEMFPVRPRLINIREDFETVFPLAMYKTFKNDVAQSIVWPYRGSEVPKILAVRPRTTFYQGPTFVGDALSNELPMRPEISVVSTVRLFFDTPGQPRKTRPARKPETEPSRRSTD